MTAESCGNAKMPVPPQSIRQQRCAHGRFVRDQDGNLVILKNCCSLVHSPYLRHVLKNQIVSCRQRPGPQRQEGDCRIRLAAECLFLVSSFLQPTAVGTSKKRCHINNSSVKDMGWNLSQ